MKKRAGITAILVSFLMVSAMALLLPAGTETAYAKEGDPAIVMGSSILEQNANTADAQIIYYGGRDWYVIGYDNTGNSYARADGVVALFQKGIYEYSVFRNENGPPKYDVSPLVTCLDTVADTGFSDAERSGIAPRRLAQWVHASYYDDPMWTRDTYNDGTWQRDTYWGDHETGGMTARLWCLSQAEAFEMPKVMRSGAQWWTRSPGGFFTFGTNTYCAYAVHSDGTALPNHIPVDNSIAVRPGFHLDKSAVLFTSAATGGKPSGEPGPDALQQPGTNSGNEWKLTVRDSARNGFSVNSVNSYDGNTLYIGYSGAQTEGDEYISAVIADSDNHIKYYGKLGVVIQPDGTVSVNTTGKLDRAAGDKLYIFNEQCNADKTSESAPGTDYSSDLIEITPSMVNIKPYEEYWDGSGSKTDPYIIENADDLGILSSMTQEGHGEATEDRYFKLDSDIGSSTNPFRERIGASGEPFCGTFDGDGHTICVDVDVNPKVSGAALFTSIENAEIRHLKVTGEVSGGRHCSGLVGTASGNCTILDCLVDVDITTSEYCGGILGHAGTSHTRIEGCCFAGGIHGKDVTAGAIWGWSDSGSTAEIINCLENGDSGYDGVSLNPVGLGRVSSGSRTENTYYNTDVIGSPGRNWTGCGKRLRRVAGTGVAFEFTGGCTEYATAQIRAYDQGMKFAFSPEDRSYIAGKDDIISFATGTPPAAGKKYVASSGTLTGSGTEYQLVMADEDVEIRELFVIDGAKVVLDKAAFTYNAKVRKPAIRTIRGLTLKEGRDYTVKWSNASSKNAGTYTVTVTGKGDYIGTAKATYKITRAANPLTVKGRTAKLKYAKLKKRKMTLAVARAIKFTKDAKDKKTYVLSSAKKGRKNFKKYFRINKTTGKVTVKKGLKKGTYKVKVKVRAAGNSNYKRSAVKAVTFKVKVK